MDGPYLEIQKIVLTWFFRFYVHKNERCDILERSTTFRRNTSDKKESILGKIVFFLYYVLCIYNTILEPSIFFLLHYNLFIALVIAWKDILRWQ